MKYRYLVLDVLFLAALITYVLAGVPLVPFHGDESTLIHTTRDYAYQFIDRDLSMVMLNGNATIDPMDQQLRLIDGRVHKYLGGLAWHLAGYTVDDLNTAWLWGTDWNYNLSEGHIPTLDLLVITRYASALLMAAGVVVVFLIGKSIGGRPAAYAAAFFYATNPALLVNGRRSMMEGSLMFFSLLTVLAGIWFARVVKGVTPFRVDKEGEPSQASPTNKSETYQVISKETSLDSPPPVYGFAQEVGRGSFLLSTLFLGLAAGLTLSSKHTAIFTLVPVFVACGLLILYTAYRSQRWIPRMVALIFAGLLALAVFYALNPTLWGDPVAGMREVLRLRSETINTQLQFFDSYDDLGHKVGGFVQYGLLDKPQYYEVAEWQTFIGDQITAYENSGFAGLVFPIPVLRLVLVVGLLIAGVIGLVNKNHPAGRWVVGIWSLGAIVAVLLVTPFEWQRYYLPAILPIVIVMGLGVQTIIQPVSDLP